MRVPARAGATFPPAIRAALLGAVCAVALALAPGDGPVGGDTALAGESVQPGDVNCSGSVDVVDSLALLRHVAGLPVSQTEPCPEIGVYEGIVKFGDVNCDGDVDVGDALTLLRFVAGLAQPPVCVLQQLLPRTIEAEQLVITSSSGPQFLLSDPRWEDVFEDIGVSPDEVEMSIATTSYGSALSFDMGVLRTEGAPWGARLNALRSATAPLGAVTFEDVPLGDRVAVKMLVPSDSTYVAVYYHVLGDLLVWVRYEDDETVSTLLARLPEAQTPSGPGPVPPGTADGHEMILHLVRGVSQPVCVGEPAGRQNVIALAMDVRFAIPSPQNFFLASSVLGGSEPPVAVAGPAASFFPKTNLLGEEESLQIEALTPAVTEEARATLHFPVQHCLNGTWEDGPRSLHIDHTADGQLKVEIETGALSCGEVGVIFTGVLEIDRFEGEDLKVCNPNICVDEGVLPRSTVAPFSALVSVDGMAIEIEWERVFYAEQQDAFGNIVCVETGREASFFTITRETFGPDLPQ